MKTNRIKYGITAALLAFAILAVAPLPAQAQLPPKVQFDRLQRIAAQSMEVNDWAKAIETYEKMAEIGVDLPAEYYYNYARALRGAKKFEDTLEILTIYITAAADEGGELYDKALSLYTTIDAALEGLREWDGPSQLREVYLNAMLGDLSSRRQMGHYYREMGEFEIAQLWYAYETD